MEDVTVKRTDLLNALKTNRDNHRAVFEAGVEEWHNRLLTELQSRVKDLRAGRKINLVINLPEPEDHTRDYDRVIRMMEMTVDDEITISEMDFNQYVMDQWVWNRSFASTAMYAASNKGAPQSVRDTATRMAKG